MTKISTRPSSDGMADETRLVDADGSAATQQSPTTGWLSSSGSIDHGRFPPGTVLGNRYRIVGRLGKGGMGEVYRADDLKLGQPVALKFLPPEVDRDPARLTQLHTEVRMARQVSHPNVCRVYDIDEVEGHTFLSMEYVDGEDLASLLRRIGRFPEERGLEIARQICAGLAAAHERDVVHRDFKPANVMVDGTGRVRITDFGLAGAGGEILRAGTPAYMAPEQLAGGEVTARSDIYALGLVLYELFSGKRAIEGSTLAELIRKREQAEIVPPSSLVRDLSPEIDRAVMRCLAPDANGRPSSALTVAASLPGGDPLAAALAAGETPSPQMVAAAGASASLSARAGVALLLCVIAGLITAAFLSDRSQLVGRVAFGKSADVLEDRAREVLAAAGYDQGADHVRGAFVNGEYLNWVSQNDTSPTRWDNLDRAPLLRFWYRTSPRPLIPLSPAWRPVLNDPPLALSGMATVVVDEHGRLQEFVAMPPQFDASAPGASAVHWEGFFTAAGLTMGDFSPVAPEWTPRVYAEQRVAWTGPMPGEASRHIRVEAASYRDRAVSFHIVWPWTRPVRMDVAPTTTSQRVFALGGAVFLLVLLAGAVALARYNLKSGRADSRGAARVALVLLGIWCAAWALGARHSFSLDAELNAFMRFIASALLNIGFTWLFYLGLEPFVRKYRPEILISWTRVLDGRLTDPRVGRDVLIGIAVGILVSQAAPLLSMTLAAFRDATPTPRASNLDFMLGARFVLSTLLRALPNALQGAMVGTFAYVLLLAISGRRRWLALAGAGVLFVLIVVAESGGNELLGNLLFASLVAVPFIFVFLRFGLLAIAVLMMTLQAINSVPLTADVTKPHALASALAILLLLAIAAYAFHASRAGQGLLRKVLPAI